MVIWFEKLISLGVLLVGELDSMLIYHPSFSHHGSASHWGKDVKNFEKYTCFQIAIPLAARCLCFHVLWVSLQNPQMQSLPQKSWDVVTMLSSDQ